MTTMLEDAVAHIRAGNTEKARPLLIEFLKQNPNSEDAWLWMTRCVTEPEQMKFCFEKVLKINPQNQHAIRGLQRLNNPTFPQVQPAVMPVQPKPVKPVKSSNLRIFIIFALSMSVLSFICICLIVLSNTPSKDGSGVTDESGGGTAAYVMCKKFVEKQLVAPATADWPPSYDIQIFTVRDKKDAYQIRGYVDAQNRVGALIRNYYVCEVSYVGNDNWHLDYLKFEE